MNTLICAGGTGTRILEAILHFCAAGLGPGELRVLVIDPDGSNGNGARLRQLLAKYLECQKSFNAGGAPGSFFSTRLDLLESEGQATGLKVWSPVGKSQKFNEVVNYAMLPKGGENGLDHKDLVHLLFTEDELGMPLDVGFRGHPSVGAAAMGLLSLFQKEPPWSILAERIRGEVSQADGSHVMIAGSVFGGTGASVIHPLARFIHGIPESNSDRLTIGALAVVPYFQFQASAAGDAADAEKAAKSEWFALATRASALFYHHLRENGDWHFDSMYWLGDPSLTPVPAFSSGGSKQENPSHVTEFLGAVACIDYFNRRPGQKACYYAGPKMSEDDQRRSSSAIHWDDIPSMSLDPAKLKRRMLGFLAAGAMHTGFLHPLMEDPRTDQSPYRIPWYLDRFASRGDHLGSSENLPKLRALSDFFAQHHFRWWREILSDPAGRIRLVNPLALHEANNGGVVADIYQLANFLPERPGAVTADKVDSFFTDMVRSAGTAPDVRGAPGYLSLLAHSAEKFTNREYFDQAESGTGGR
ncbi:MAG: hypothetical protein ACKV2U_32880 [Bryobacteraceae bacterium]